MAGRMEFDSMYLDDCICLLWWWTVVSLCLGRLIRVIVPGLRVDSLHSPHSALLNSGRPEKEEKKRIAGSRKEEK